MNKKDYITEVDSVRAGDELKEKILKSSKCVSIHRSRAPFVLAACFVAVIVLTAVGMQNIRMGSASADTAAAEEVFDEASVQNYAFADGNQVSDSAAERVFTATVIEVSGDCLLVEPSEGTDERNSCDRIYVTVPEGTDISLFNAGDTVSVAYDGVIEELYPANIPNTYGVSVIS